MRSSCQRRTRSSWAAARIAASAALLVLAGCRGPATRKPLATENEHSFSPFSARGLPIHPRVVLQLMPDLMGEETTVTAIDLDAKHAEFLSDSNVTIGPDCVVSASLPHHGLFSYRELGITGDGVHVLMTSFSGGGSGLYRRILCVRLVHDVVSDDRKCRERTMLLKVATVVLGDRDDGVVRLHRSALFIGRSRYRDADLWLSFE